MARDSEIDSEVDARFALSLHVFVSRLFGWTLLEGAVRGARFSSKKDSEKKRKKKKKNSSKLVRVRQNSSTFVKVYQFVLRTTGPANCALQECPTEKA